MEKTKKGSLDYFNEKLRLGKNINEADFKHSTVYYVKSLLEAKFKRTFNLDEVEGLLSEEFNWKGV